MRLRLEQSSAMTISASTRCAATAWRQLLSVDSEFRVRTLIAIRSVAAVTSPRLNEQHVELRRSALRGER
jgi:hypothetical protein